MSDADIYDRAAAVAPVAVGVFDVDRPQDVEIGTTADGRAYRSALVVLRRGGQLAGAMVLAADGDRLAAEELARAARRALGEVAGPATPLPVTGPLATVVVTTCAQPEPLMRCLDSLMASTYRSMEIVVVENRPSPSSPTRDVVRGFPRVTYVEEPVPGLSRARNAGFAAAQGEIVAFTDDDVVVEPDWLAALVAGFDTAPDVAAVTGLILPMALDSEAQLLFEQFTAFGKGFVPVTHRLAEGRAANPLFPYTAGALGSGANTAVRASVLRALDGFDVALGAGTPAMGGEDLDLLIRIVLAGHAIRYEPRALLWHEHPASMERLTAQARAYGVGLAAMAAKHVRGDERAYLLRQVPRIAGYLLSPGSRKNAAKGPEFPRGLVVRERLGMLEGPAALARSRRLARRADLAADGFRPTWVGTVDLARGVEGLQAPSRVGAPYAVARVLVREGHEPLGFAEVALDPAGRATADAVRAAIDARVGAADVPADAPAAADVPTPRVTVAVSTRDREVSLRAALRSLLELDYPNYEIVVVDNAARTDATARVVAALADDRLRMVVEPVAGLSKARNTAVAHATGEIVAFTDDDVVADPWWLRAIARGFARDAGVACVTGMVPSAELETPAQAYFDRKVSWADSCAPRLYDLGAHRVDHPLYPYLAGTFGAGANFAVRRDALAEVGPFDEALGAGSPAKGGEDIDYFLRVVLAGKAIAYEPAAIVWHFHRRELSALQGQLDGYGSSLSAFAFKHLLTPATAADVVRRVPAGVGRMRELRGRGEGGDGDPLKLWMPELSGFARGPARYLRGRRATRAERP